MTKISVLIGLYNCAETVVEALDSLYSQTFLNFKIILCEDGSKDNTYKVACEYAKQHDNIILLRNEYNKGLNYTLNRCLEYADTPYVARMDGDDISLPMRFEKEYTFLEAHPEFAMVSSSMIYFDENGDYRTGKVVVEPQRTDFVMGTPFSHAPCMIRTSIIKQVGGYSVDERLLRVEDYHLWFKLYAAGYRGANLQEPLYKMRDDRNACRRRTFKSRLNEAYVKYVGYKMLELPFYCQIFVLRPIIIGFLPNCIYRFLHKTIR